MIKPSVGRVVWYYPAAGDPCFSASYKAPYAAHIAYVWSDTCVNLMVISPEGQPLQKTSVELVHDDSVLPPNQSYCAWMPFQKGQAQKTEALEQKLKEST